MPLVVHPHFHSRRTGVTRHVETMVDALAAEPGWEACVLGWSVGVDVPRVGLEELGRRARREPLVWHAHRNNELQMGVLLRSLGWPLHVVFTRHAAGRPSWPTRLLAKRADRLIAISDAVRRDFSATAQVVRHGVDVAKLRPRDPRSVSWGKLGLAGEAGIGVVGRIRPAKGQQDFLNAVQPLLEAHPTWRAILVGRLQRQHRRWFQSLPTHPRVQHVPEQHDVVPWYQGLSILVQPSHQEGLGLAALEGMAAGCCVVASDVSDMAQIIEHGRTGFLYPPGDVAALRGILATLMQAPAQIDAVGEAAAAQAARALTLAAEAKALRRIYAELTDTN